MAAAAADLLPDDGDDGDGRTKCKLIRIMGDVARITLLKWKEQNTIVKLGKHDARHGDGNSSRERAGTATLRLRRYLYGIRVISQFINTLYECIIFVRYQTRSNIGSELRVHQEATPSHVYILSA
jgi:hypothetical protein